MSTNILETIVKDEDIQRQFDINDEILESYFEKIIHYQAVQVDKNSLIKYVERHRMDSINIPEIIGSKENAERLLEEYKHIQNLIEKEYFSRY